MVRWSNDWQRRWSNATGKTSPQVVQSRWQATRARADLGHDLVEREAVLGCPQAHPTGLALEVVTLVVELTRQ